MSPEIIQSCCQLSRFQFCHLCSYLRLDIREDFPVVHDCEPPPTFHQFNTRHPTTGLLSLHSIMRQPPGPFVLARHLYNDTHRGKFLANVNSRSRSLYVVARPSVVCLSSVVGQSLTFVRPTQAIEIFGNIFTPFGTLAINDLSVKILRRSSQGNPSVGG